MRRPDELLDHAAASLSAELANGITRRSFLGRLGATVMTALGGASVAAAFAPEKADAFHLCGHIWTTGSCPSPSALPRIDRLGYPIRVADGRPVDNLGRLVDPDGFPVNEHGDRLLDPNGDPLGPAPRTRICEDWVPERFGISAVTQGSWYRCCNGQIRKLVDCCSPHRRRINGDASLTGYCYTGRRVFCVMYYDTHLPC
jgi:hypothetical protein